MTWRSIFVWPLVGYAVVCGVAMIALPWPWRAIAAVGFVSATALAFGAIRILDPAPERIVRTWHLEIVVVATVLGALAAVTGGPVEWIGAGAVTLSFAHAQVADRLAEREATRSRDQRSVSCYRWATRYLLGKEALWLVYFTLHQSWTALAGVALFLAYPAWRRWYRAERPIDRSRAA